MHPHTETTPGMPTEPLPIARVNTGMEVVDQAGDRVGTVTAVQMPDTDVRPDVPAGVAEALMASGYLRIDASGVFASDVYASGDDVAEVSGSGTGAVRLTVAGDTLQRAAS